MSQENLDAMLQSFFDKIDKRLESVEEKLDNRLTNVETRCGVLENDAKKTRNEQKKVINEVSKLRMTVDILEQQKLDRNVVLKGVPELETSDDMLEFMVDKIFCKFDDQFESQFVLNVYRIGVKKNDKRRLIIAELASTKYKSKLMKDLKDKAVNCSQFLSGNKVPWGPATERIYLSDHLTRTMSNIFYHARQLKKEKRVNYVWTKMGKIFIKKDDTSRAHQIKSIADLCSFKQKLNTDDADEEEYTESEMDIQSDLETASQLSAESKRRRSHEGKTGRRSPSKRQKKVTNKNK